MLAAQKGGPSAPVSTTDPMDAAMLAAHNPQPPADTSETPEQNAQPHTPTRYQRSVAAPSQGGPPQNLTWGQAGQQAVQNLVPSAAGAVGSMWNAVTHPIQTLGAVGQLGTGLISQGEDIAGIPQDPNTRARSQAVVRAVEHHYATTYGSEQGFKSAVATDPASILLDASTFLDGAGAVADAANMTHLAGALRMINPVNAAAKAVTLPVKAAITNPVTRTAQGLWSGVDPGMLRIATTAGAETNPALRDVFRTYAGGQGDPTLYLQRVQGAIGQVRNDFSQNYMAQRAGLAQTPVDLTNTYNALDTADQFLAKGGPEGFDRAKEAAGQARQIVDGLANSNDPAMRNIDNVDVLKRKIWDLNQSVGGNAEAQNALGGIYNGVKADLVAADPEYANMMEQYQLGLKEVDNVTKTFGVGGRNPAATAAMTKGLRAIRTPGGSDLLDQIAAKDPTIPYMLAGNAVAPWTAKGAQGWLEAALTLGATGIHSPWLLPALAAQSPRLAGAMNYAAGSLGRIGDAAGPMAAAKLPYYAGRVQQEQANPMQPSNTASAPANSNLASTPYAQKVMQAEGVTNAGVRGGFMPSTWLPLVRKYRPDLAGVPDSQVLAMRDDPGMVGQMIDRLGDEHAASLQQAGVPVNDATKWGAHWLGPRGFPVFFHALQADPNTPMSAIAGQLGLNVASMHANTFDGALNTVGKVADRIQRRMGVPINSATGGRITAATGGKIEEGKSVEELLAKLMARSEQVKRIQKKATAPLLKVPDNAIAAALKTVRQSI
jgi:hypothetical protein